MKNLFNDIPQFEKNRILEIHGIKRVYLEQDSFESRFNRSYSTADGAAKANKEIKDFYNQYHHQINTIASIGLSLIPIVGPIIGTAVALVDAKQYYNENDKKTAGMVAMFSMIPYVGTLITKIPGVKELGVKGMAALASKLGKSQKLTQAEENIVKSISTNQKLVQDETAEIAMSLSQKIKTGVVNTGKVVVKKVAPYAASYVGYNKGYDYAQRKTPKTKSEKENLNWDFVKSSFGSSGSLQDNTLLNQAWNSGWRPGNVVPKQFQTLEYQKQNVYNQEAENIKKLMAMTSSSK
jgi:hypothetical protein